MHFLTKLKTTSLYRLLINNLFLIAISVLLTLCFLNHYIFIIFIILYYIFIYKKNKKLLIIIIIISLLLIISFYIKKVIIYDKNIDTFSGLVISISKKEYYNKILIQNGIYKIYVYDYDFLDINIGDKIDVRGINKTIESNHIPYLFNYQKYYYSKNIISIIKAETLTINKSFNIFYLRKIIYQYINNNYSDQAKAFIFGMVLGDTSFLSEDTKDAITINNISHLFAISGLHINIIVLYINKLLSLFIKKDNQKENIIIIILLLYLFITNFSVSILRASLMYIFNIYSNRLDLKLKNLDIASFIFIILSLINPFYMYNLGFVLSFSACFVIIIFSNTIKYLNIKINNIMEILLITFILQVATFPVIINLNNSFNILSIMTNGFFITIVSIFILPFTIITLFIPLFKYIYEYVIKGFDYLNILFSKYFSINIKLPSFSIYEIIIYYLFIIILIIIINKINKKKLIIYFVSLFIFLFIHYEKINLNINGNIYFLDMYEGDATVIDLPFGKGLVIIDTGSQSNDLRKFLDAVGVRKIDYLILTHKHLDHVGNSDDLINNYKVRNVVISIYNDMVFDNTIYVKGGDTINLNNYVFYILSPNYKSNEENDNSIVLLTKLGNYNYLFLGDSTKRIEEEISKNNINVDVVKVGHHGSNTSTSEILYEKIKPEYVIIETGRKEKYSFPNYNVIKYLSKYKVLRTDEDYTISVKFNNHKTIFKKTRKDF